MTVDLPDFGADGPAAAARESGVVVIGGKQRSTIRAEQIRVRRYRCECVIDQLNAWGQLTDRQWRAGVGYRFFWLLARRGGSVTMRWEDGARQSSSAAGAPLEARETAIRRITEIWRHIGTEHGSLLAHVAGEDNYPGRTIERLREALLLVADFLDVPADYVRDG